MILYVIITAITVLLSYGVVAYGKLKNPDITTRQSVVNRIFMAAIFTLLFSLSALRIYTGNDYNTYVSRFHDIYFGIYVVTEEGFNAIVHFLYWLFNSECFLIVFALFAALTVWVFIEGIYKQSKSFVLSFFLFMTLGLYFQSFNTVRYYFALAICFYSMQYVIKKDYFKFLVIILIASLFHKSSLVVIPVYLLAMVPWKKWCVFLLTLICPCGLIFRNQLMDLFVRLYPSYRYEEEYLAGGYLSVVNIARCLMVLVLCIMARKIVSENREYRFYFYLNYAALMLYTFFYYIPFVSRIGYYINVSHILLIPGIISAIEDQKKKKILTALVIVAGILYFAFFLYKAYGDSVKVLPYMTWLFDSVEFKELEKALY